MSSTAGLFIPYKSVGYISDGRCVEVSHLGDETFVTVSNETFFQVYKLDTLKVVQKSSHIKHTISFLKTTGTITVVAGGSSLYVFDRGQLIHEFDHGEEVEGLELIGNIAICYGSSGVVKAYDVHKRQLVRQLQLLSNRKISFLMHPATYLNKILIGFSDGGLQLWNFNSQELIYDFECISGFFGEGKAPEISTIAQSPANDIVFVGFESGHILFINLKLDKVLRSLKQDNRVTSLSFRNDAAGANFPYVTSTSSTGHLYVWNLNGNPPGKLQFRLENVHHGKNFSAKFVNGEPIMVTCGSDNSLKVWIYDSAAGTCRVLRERAGHVDHPIKLRHYGGSILASMGTNSDALSCEVVSCGSDGTIRIVNTAIESQNRELSQAKLFSFDKTLPAVLALDLVESRELSWGNIVTIHQNHPDAHLWSSKLGSISDTILKHPKAGPYLFPSSIGLSSCANFCVIGYTDGSLLKFNIQSGKFRGSFPLPQATEIVDVEKILAADMSTKKRRKVQEKVEAGHTAMVVGVYVETTNRFMVSAGKDGSLIQWDFVSQQRLKSANYATQFVALSGERNSNFFWVTSSDRVVYLFDATEMQLIRRFSGFTREITDVCISPDAKYLMAASADAHLRCWDIPTSRLISWQQFDAAILSISMHPSGEYLEVVQQDKVGLELFLDRSLYGDFTVNSEPSAPSPIEAVRKTHAVTEVEASDAEDSDADSNSDGEASADNDDAEDADDAVAGERRTSSAHKKGKTKTDTSATATEAPVASPMDAAVEGCCTYSTTPKSYWLRLLQFDQTRGNIVTKAATTERPAPFLLTATLGAPSPAADATAVAEDKKAKSASRLISLGNKPRNKVEEIIIQAAKAGAFTISATAPEEEQEAFLRALYDQADFFGHYDHMEAFLRKETPVAVDLLFRGLCWHEDDAYGKFLVRAMMNWVFVGLEKRDSFDLVEGYLRRLLEIYGQTILSDPRSLEEIKQLQASHSRSRASVLSVLKKNLCVLKLLANIPNL